MGMDPISWAVIGAAAVSAGSAISQGDAAKEAARKNALLLEEKSLMIDIQKDLEAKQYDRLASRTLSSSLAAIGAAGLGPGGSAMAVMLDVQKQIQLDKAVGQIGYEQEKRYTDAEARAGIERGKVKQRAGYMDAFSTMLTAGYKVGQYNISQGATRAGRA